MLDILSWNCQRAGYDRFVAHLLSFCGPHRPDLVFIFEPRISDDHARQVIAKIGFDGSLIADAVGFARGIWVLWRESNLEVTEITRWEQMIHMKCARRGGSGTSVLVSAVYGSPHALPRNELWAELRRLSGDISLPWLLTGNFNSILSPRDGMGGAEYNDYRTRAFRSCVDDCALLEVGFTGPRFTWRRGNISQ
ncbi:unnamed protein product [Linum trigynum]|uniref:Endonuclease/exonuclease/phosphatase domain-containing protein n=1 Tax=Linum trigynum TaxID=586398 RepID=A0AAV2D692_9ROSI